MIVIRALKTNFEIGYFAFCNPKVMKYLLIFLLIIKAITSTACDCKPRTLKEHYDNSSLIIKGTEIHVEMKQHVLSKIEIDSLEKMTQRKIFSDTISFFEYTLRVEKTIKSKIAYDTIQVRSGANKSNCDIYLTENKTYLLYAFNASQREEYLYPRDFVFPVFYSSICTRTTENWKKEMKLLKNRGLRSDLVLEEAIMEN